MIIVGHQRYISRPDLGFRALRAQDPRWFHLSKIPALAFDHARILKDALKRL